MIQRIIWKHLLSFDSVRADHDFWQNRPAEERIQAVELLRKEHYGSTTLLQRVVRVIKQTLS
jgi:hypothetical protein